MARDHEAARARAEDKAYELGSDLNRAGDEIAHLQERLREIEEAARVALDATEEPCTCYEEPYAPCSYCGPFMRLRTALEADRGGQGE